MGKSDMKKVVWVYNTLKSSDIEWEMKIWHSTTIEMVQVSFWSLFLGEVSGSKADVYLSDHSEKAGFLWVERKDRKGSILSLPIFNMCLIPVLLASTL